jgi:hypothetical protein
MRPRPRLHHLTIFNLAGPPRGDIGRRSGEAWLRKLGCTASILGVEEDKQNGERKGFACWSGYRPERGIPMEPSRP